MDRSHRAPPWAAFSYAQSQALRAHPEPADSQRSAVVEGHCCETSFDFPSPAANVNSLTAPRGRGAIINYHAEVAMGRSFLSIAVLLSFGAALFAGTARAA